MCEKSDGRDIVKEVINMAKKLTEKALVKKLDTMSREELTKIIVDFYKTNKSIEEGLSLMILGEEYGSALLEKYKKQLYKIFNPTNIVRTGFSLEKAQMVLSDFADVCIGDNGRWYGDLALYFAECATNFTMSYGDIDEDFYDALGDAYHDAVVIASGEEQLYKLWKERLEYILYEFSGFGWGMEDFIAGEYYSLPWIEED